MSDWRHETESWEPEEDRDAPPAWAAPDVDEVESTAWAAPETELSADESAWAAPEIEAAEPEEFGWLTDDEPATKPRGWSFDLQVPATPAPVRIRGEREEPPAEEPRSLAMDEPEPQAEAEQDEPADEEDEAGERGSIFKRELSFRRRRRAGEPRERRQRKERKPRRRPEPEPEPEAELELPDEARLERPKRPLLKRELSFRRRARRGEPLAHEPEVETQEPVAPPEPEPEPDVLEVPVAATRTRAKRELGLGRTKRIVGLKIGASQMAAAQVVNNGGPHLVQLARSPLEPGIVVGGELRDPDALAEALRDFFREAKLPRRGVRLGIANNRIGVRSFEITGIEDPKQLENAIRFRAQETLPIPIDEAVIDHRILQEGVGEDGQPVRKVLLVVAYRELVDRYVEACRKAGIRLVGVDLEAFALLRALSPSRADDEEAADAATVAVALGSDRSIFAVSDGRTCEFTRVLEWGGYALNVAVARALDVAPSEAEPIKRALSLNGTEVPAGLTEEQAEKARESIRRQVGGFARELVSSLQFYQNQPGSLDLSTIMLTGGTAHLPGLAEELERLTGVAVRVGDPLERVSVGKKVRTADAQMGSLAVAIGLGIED